MVGGEIGGPVWTTTAQIGFAPVLVGHPDDRDHVDVGMSRHRVLDLARRHVLPTGDDDVLATVDNAQPTSAVDDPDVPRMQPPPGERTGRGCVVAPVALHHLHAPHDHLARLTWIDWFPGGVDDADLHRAVGHTGGAQDRRSPARCSAGPKNVTFPPVSVMP